MGKAEKEVVIDLTTPEKAQAYFDRLKDENKPTIEDLKRLSDEELEARYQMLQHQEVLEFDEESRRLDYIENDVHEAKVARNNMYKAYFESQRSSMVMHMREVKAMKRKYNFALTSLANSIRNNVTFQIFKSQFDIGLRTQLKISKLTTLDFTEKELKRFYDFSLNSTKNQFGF